MRLTTFFLLLQDLFHPPFLHIIQCLSQPVWASCSVVAWAEGHSPLGLKFNGFFLVPHIKKSQISKVQTFPQELIFDNTEHDRSKSNSQAKYINRVCTFKKLP